MTLPKPYYEDSAVTIYHADCREILPHLPKVDLVITDPPYEITATGGGIAAARQYLAGIAGKIDGGFDMSLIDGFENFFCFCGKEQLRDLLNMAAREGSRWMLLTWNKPNPTPLVNANYLPDTEYIVHRFQSGRLFGNYKDKSRFIVHPSESTRKEGHPCAKPLAVIKRLALLGSQVGDTILDPFMGSGTTLRAAKDLGRKAIGIEIEEKYCEIAARRCRQEVLALEFTP